MIGWFMVLSFVLGFGLTWVYVVRSVSRTVDPVDARRVAGTAGRPLVRQRRVSAARDSDLDSDLDSDSDSDIDPDDEVVDGEGSRGAGSAVRRRSPVVPRVVEFEDDTETFYERER